VKTELTRVPTAQRERESEGVGEQFAALTGVARGTEREQGARAREVGVDRLAPAGRGRKGGRACEHGLVLIGGTHLSSGADERARGLAGLD
jgi:hypothetical protein